MIFKKFPCHFEKFQKDETQCQWLNKDIDRSKRKMCLFDQPQHFHESLEQFISSLHTKNFKISDEISSKCNMEKNCFVLTKKPRFCEKFGSQIKFFAIKVLT